MRGDPNDSSFIRTASGRYFWPLEPRVEDIFIEDIAHSLSNQCRWTGHTKEFYSVAQHCAIVASELPVDLRLTGLLHDASEAYLVDLARPIKHAPGLGEIYREVEGRLEKVLAERFGTIYPLPEEVKRVDNILLHSEKRDLMVGDWVEKLAGEQQLLPYKIIPWSKPKKIFLAMFEKLGGK